MTKTVTLIRYHQATGGASSVLAPEDNDAFNTTAPGGFSRGDARVIEVEGRYFELAADCPEDGYALWTADAPPEIAARDRDVLSLPPDLRERLFPDYQTWDERIAQKRIDDAEMLERIADSSPKQAAKAAESAEP